MHGIVQMYYQDMSARLHALELRNVQQSRYPTSTQEDVDPSSSSSYMADLRLGSAAESLPALECDSTDHDYTEELSRSRVYSRNAAFRMSTFSSDHYSTTWSCLSALSLSDVSNISVINLAITVKEVNNPQRLSQTWSNANQATISAARHRDTSSNNSSNTASAADMSLQWPIDRVLIWLAHNGFSNDWRETFKILDIQGHELLEPSETKGERGRLGLMYELVYPVLARECSKSGTRWDQTRERTEGRRLRRLIRGLIDGTEALTSSAVSQPDAETSSIRTIARSTEPTNWGSLTKDLSTPIDRTLTDARELSSPASPRDACEGNNYTIYLCHAVIK